VRIDFLKKNLDIYYWYAIYIKQRVKLFIYIDADYFDEGPRFFGTATGRLAISLLPGFRKYSIIIV